MKNTNLTKLCGNLGVDELNGIIVRMNELSPAVYSLKMQYSSEENSSDLSGMGAGMSFEEDMLLRLVLDIDEYMQELDCEKLFGSDEMKYPTKDDFRRYIERYDYLMSDAG